MRKDLYRAAISDDVKELDKLDRQDVDVFSEFTRAENSVLHIAAYHGSRKCVRRLLPKIRRADLEGNGFLRKQNEQGNTALHEAASGGNAEIVDMLLKKDSELVVVTNKAGETAVFKASIAGHYKIIEKIGDVPVEMYTRKSDGKTSLHCAVYNKQIDVIKTLIKMKPKLVSIADTEGRTPLHFAALIPPLQELVPPFHPWLHDKHVKQNLYIANMLLDKDKDLCDKLDKIKQTPLHIAVKEGNETMVKLILEKGGDCLEEVDNEGRNAVHLAVINAELIFERNSELTTTMLQTLVSASKMSINDADKKGKTPVDIAIESMDKDELLFSGIIKLLQANGAVRNLNGAVLNVNGQANGAVPNVEKPLLKTEPSKSKWKSEIISWNAVLIGTVAFAAPFDLLQTLGGSDLENELRSVSQSERNLFVLLRYAFFLSDTIALGTSVASTILLLFAVFGKKEDSPMVETSFLAVMVALLSILVAFGSAIGLVLGPKYLWLTVMVWFMLCITPLAIRVRTFHSKLYLFTETKNFIKFVVEDTLGLIITLIMHYLDIAKILCWSGIIQPIFKWAKKLCTR
ncbi:hypothetical protein KI387_014205 [Taxus chinensis]|uniref:PGG domain-containing protein n=1 Tax=Taxus chinensis TaxID=29808 RepID=A0AA38FHZ9_TAXCH|nr:hypothetical protein KI387_014205 [Taxus chinensis]